MPPRQVVDLNQIPAAMPTDPRAAGYAAGAAARRAGLPKVNVPVDGGPPPPIPALEQPHQVGRTMADQAMVTRGHDAQRHVAQAMGQHMSSGGIVVPDQPAPYQEAPAPQNLSLLPTDILPEEAMKDPSYQHGAGSRMAQMQPHMASKYGVLRNGRHLTPNDLVNASSPPDFRGLRPRRQASDIARDLQQVMSAPTGKPPTPQVDDGPTPPPGLPRTEEEAVAQAVAGPGGAAERAGASPVPPILDASTEESEERAKRMISELDDFDFERLRREMLSDVLKNPGQREAVEKRLQPLDIEQLILHNKIRQRVPVLPKKFEPTYESMPGDVELKLKQLLVKETKSIAVTEAYLLDKYAVMTTTAGTVAINNNPLPSMYDSSGNFDEELFWEKFRWMLQRNIHMLASLGIHYSWFEQRVRKLFVADEGKGG